MESVKEKAKSKTKNKALGYYQTAPTVTGLSYSETFAIVQTQNKNPSRVEIPDALRDVKLCRAYIRYLQSPEFLKKSPTTRYSEAREIKDFFSFLLEFLEAPDYRIPREIIAHYKSWMIRYKTSYGTSTIYRCIIVHTTIFSYITTSSNLPESLKDPIFNTCLASANATSTQGFSGKDDSDSVPSLVQLFPNCPFDDTEMVHSLRAISAFIILEFDRIRQVLLDRPEIQTALEELSTQDISLHPLSRGVFRLEKDSTHTKKATEESCRLYRILLDAVLEIDDPLMLELAYLNLSPTVRKHLFAGRHPNSKQIKDAFGLFTKGPTITPNTTLTQANSVSIGFYSWNTLTYRDLLMPTDIEVFTMQCLLASDRIQSSGLNSLNIEDINLDEDRMQTTYFKNRRRLSNRYTNTLMSSGLLHATAQVYKHKIKAIQPRLPKEKMDRALPFLTDSMRGGYIGTSVNQVSEFYALLVNANSMFHDQLISCIDDENSNSMDSQAFLWIVEKLIANNQKLALEERKYSKEFRQAKKTGSPAPKRGTIVRATEVSLAPNFIGKSVSNIHSGTNVSPKNQNSGNTNQTDIDLANHIIAESQGHTLAVKAATYNERSNSKESIRSNAAFAEQVGDAFEAGARAVSNFLAEQKTKIVPLSELKRVLGLTTASEDLADIIEDLDLEVGLVGEIKHGPEKLFVATTETAAFMTLHIKHLESEVGGLIAQGHMTLAQKVFEERVLLESALKQFPANMISAGTELSKELDIQFPPYTELYEG